MMNGDLELRLTMPLAGWFELQRRLVMCESSTKHLTAFNEQMSKQLDRVMGLEQPNVEWATRDEGPEHADRFEETADGGDA